MVSSCLLIGMGRLNGIRKSCSLAFPESILTSHGVAVLLSKLIYSVFSRLLGISQLSVHSELTDCRLTYFIARAAYDFCTFNLRATFFFDLVFLFLLTNGKHLRSLLFGLIRILGQCLKILKLCCRGSGNFTILNNKKEISIGHRLI